MIGSSLPSVVVISLVKVEIWSILILNLRIRTYLIILLQSVTIQVRWLFWHISYYKARQSNFITKCERLLLESVSGITKCDRFYYKMHQVLQIAAVVTKWEVTFVNGVEIYKFKANYSKIDTVPLCLGNISKDFSVDNMKKTGINGSDALTLMLLLLMIY